MDSDVSVVIPTRDRAGLLRQTLRSVREQTFPPADIIVADDGSRDNTAIVADDFSCRRVHNPDGGWGAAGARNAGLEQVRTPFVVFLDSDDLLLPGAIAALRSRLLSEPAAPFAFGRALIARFVDGRWVPEGLIAPARSELAALPSALFARNFVPSSGALVRIEEARAVGGFLSGAESYYNEDFYFWVHLALRDVPVHVPTIVSVYRVHAGTASSPLLTMTTSWSTGSGDGTPRWLQGWRRISAAGCASTPSMRFTGGTRCRLFVGRLRSSA